MSDATGPVRVGIEMTARKVFASALDWPGWSRAGTTESDALEALAVAHGRFVAVARSAGATEPPGGPYAVIQSLPGDATTAFGAPSIVFDADREPVDAAAAERLARLVEAAWAALDRIAGHSPVELRKGPRGGGRDRDKVLEHVAGAHEGYVRPLGARPARGATDSDRRAAMLGRLRQPWDGTPSPDARWPPRYAARRVAWHALDHAWEIEDRSDP